MDVLFTAECDVCSGVVVWLGRHSYIPCRPCLAQVGAVGSRLWQGAVRRCGSMIDLAVWYPTIEPRCSAASAAISQAMIWKGARCALDPAWRETGGPGRERPGSHRACQRSCCRRASAQASPPAPELHEHTLRPARRRRAKRNCRPTAPRQDDAASVSWPARDVSFPYSAKP